MPIALSSGISCESLEKSSSFRRVLVRWVLTVSVLSSLELDENNLLIAAGLRLEMLDLDPSCLGDPNGGDGDADADAEEKPHF